MTGSEADRQPYDVYAKLQDPMGVLSIALGQWEDRDDSKAQPEVRRAANTAMDAIDLMVRELHAMRSRLPGRRAAQDLLRIKAMPGPQLLDPLPARPAAARGSKSVSGDAQEAERIVGKRVKQTGHATIEPSCAATGANGH